MNYLSNLGSLCPEEDYKSKQKDASNTSLLPHSMTMSPRSERIHKETDLEYEQACEKAVEEVVFETDMEDSSDEDDEEEDTLKKRQRELDKEADLNVVMKEIKTMFVTVEKSDAKTVKKSDVKTVEKQKIVVVASKFVYWKRRALKANKELDRIKRSCSCDRAVKYPWIFRK